MPAFLSGLLAKAGNNVGTATGAAAGEVKASGDVFALGKAKGLQAQIADYTIVDGSAWVNLSTSVQILTGCTTTFTPTINETVIVWMSYRLNCGAGSAACNAGDNSRAYLFLNAVQQGGGVEILAPGGVGVLWGTYYKKLSLSANTAYTLDLRASNLTGNRGQGLGNFMLLRLAG